MASIVISGDTSGSITVSAPAVAGSNTISLPAVTGTVMVTGNMPAFSAYLAADQSVSSATATKVTINTENFDTANCFDSTTNYRFTPNVAGYYQVNGLVYMGTGSTTTSFLSIIYKNGAAYKRAGLAGVAIIGGGSTVSDIIYLNGTTDYVELYGSNTSSITPSFTGGQIFTYFSASLVRAS